MKIHYTFYDTGKWFGHFGEYWAASNLLFMAYNSGEDRVLHVNRESLEQVKDYWKGEIRVLEPLKYNTVSSAKIDVLKSIPLGDVQCDLDTVILDTSKFEGNHDLLVQFVEAAENPQEVKKWLLGKEYNELAAGINGYGYNCGTTQFKNQELKNLYIDSYYKLLDIYDKYAQESFDNPGWIDALFEQCLLERLSEGYKVEIYEQPGVITYPCLTKSYEHYLADSKVRHGKYIYKRIKDKDAAMAEKLLQHPSIKKVVDLEAA